MHWTDCSTDQLITCLHLAAKYAVKLPVDLGVGGVFHVHSRARGAVEYARCFRGRCNFEPAVIVRDPMPARYRLTQ